MKNKRLLILAGLLFISTMVTAQKGVVYLKNGSVVRGSIINQPLDGSVKIETGDNSIWVFEPNAIDSVSFKTKHLNPLHTGYFNLTEAGVLAGNSDNNKKAPFTIMNISGWQLANGISAGIGVGVEFFSETYLPVVADFRYTVQRNRTMPFAGLQAGYSIALENADKQYIYNYPAFSNLIWPGPTGQEVEVDARGGFLVNPSIGFISSLNDNMAMTFSVGYRIMRHRYSRGELNKLDVDFNRLSIKIGLLFK